MAKDSHLIEGLGELPIDWAIATLSDTIRNEKKMIVPNATPNEKFEYYSIPAYHDKKHVLIEKGGNILSQKFIVNPNTVLFGKLNPRVPKVWLVEKGTDIRKIASTEFIPLDPNDRKIRHDFLYYLCWTNYLQRAARDLVSGSTPSRQRVDIRAFVHLPIPLPSLAEQRAIAHLLRVIDKAKEATEKVIAATQQLKQSLTQHLFTCGPVPFYKADQVEFKYEDVGEIPNHWDVYSLKDVAEVKTSTSTLKVIEKAEKGKESVFYLKVSDMNHPLNQHRIRTAAILNSHVSFLS